jgi:hypothetical protein
MYSDIVKFIESKTPIIERELQDLKDIVRKGGKQPQSIFTHIVILEMRLEELKTIKQLCHA